MTDFHTAMRDKEELRELSNNAAEHCGEKFDDRAMAAACRYGIGQFSQRLVDRIETDDPRTAEGKSDPASSIFD